MVNGFVLWPSHLHNLAPQPRFLVFVGYLPNVHSTFNNTHLQNRLNRVIESDVIKIDVIKFDRDQI